MLFSQLNAQKTNNDVLFVVGGEPVYTSEFLRVYNKNLDLVQDESQKDVDEYLKLFTNYKLKLKEARALGFDKKPAYLRELKNYKKQLAKNFLTDTKVTNALIEEAYERISYDIKASHILIKVSENASPQDTLVAYNNIVSLRNRALQEGFENVRTSVHNGKSIYGEDLGYFSGFKMVYKFESMAFNTPVGEISKPFRTQFGYHIINVIEKRKSRGECTVAHIMVVDKKEDTIANNAEIRINEIYKKLNQGEVFEALAKQFSDDRSSASKGGQMAPFSSGQISSKIFEDTAFSLKNNGDVSQPIKSKFGWHIIKLIDKKPIASFKDMKSELENKVKRDSRSKLIDDALHDKLKVKYSVKPNPEALAYFTSILNDDYYKRTWRLPNNFDNDKPLVKIGNKQITYKAFGDALVRNQKGIRNKEPFVNLVSNAYNNFLNTSLVNYQEDNLENENTEFAYIVNEYRDGLLLFDLMETTIWNSAKNDTLGIQNYYKTNKDNYIWPERVDAIVASSANQNVLKKVSKLLAKNKELSEIKETVNTNGDVNVIFTTGEMEANHQALPNHFKFEKGISKIYKHNDAFIVVKVKEVLPKKQKTLKEAKGLVTSDYQVFKEDNWLKTLRAKYKVEINKEALAKVKQKIKNQ
ncbi:peptidylprolyl isomerase [Postechiella marina]|uniref:Peptidylprolyl isomerase n=1 Tax=Postechiella marina TaxID=943941 RepID=A0ABP8C904_9FLAO